MKLRMRHLCFVLVGLVGGCGLSPSPDIPLIGIGDGDIGDGDVGDGDGDAGDGDGDIFVPGDGDGDAATGGTTAAGGENGSGAMGGEPFGGHGGAR